jgi:hypothetical protein
MDQCFFVMYHLKLSWGDLRTMSRTDREWMLTKTNAQLKYENDQIKQAQKK